MENQKRNMILVLGLIFVAAVAVMIYVGYWNKEDIQTAEQTPEQIRAQKQMQELAKIRESREPLTPEQVQTQMEELENLKKDAGNKTLSPEEVAKQLEELNKLRANR